MDLPRARLRALGLIEKDDEDDEELDGIDSLASGDSDSDDGEDRCECTPRIVRRLIVATLGVVLIILFVVGAWIFEGWPPLTSLYFAMQVMTTIGFGDVTVERDEMKLFTAFWCLAVLIFAASAVNELISWRYRRHEKALIKSLVAMQKKSFRWSKHDANLKCYRVNRLVMASLFFALNLLFGFLFFGSMEKCISKEGQWLYLQGNQTCEEMGGHTKDWPEAFYMSVITCTTIGFGDHTPRTRLGRAISIVWMPIGVISAATFLGAAQQFMEELCCDKPLWERFMASKMSKRKFKTMDRDGSGYATRAQFQGYLLERSGLVSEHIWVELDRMFDYIAGPGKKRITYERLRERLEDYHADPGSYYVDPDSYYDAVEEQ